MPQTENVFPGLTVFENLQMGALLRTDPIDDTLDEIFALFPDSGRQAPPARRAVVGRAAPATGRGPRADDPAIGAASGRADRWRQFQRDELFGMITRIAAQGLAVPMVEQNAAGALEIADTGFVLVQGANRFTGTGRELLADPETRRSFLGGRA